MTVDSTQGTPTWLGAVNDRTGLALLLEHGPLTRNRICELAGVSKPTASLMMARLEQAGLIEQAGRSTGNPGRSAIVYRAALDRALGVAIDIDGHELRATLVDASGSTHPMITTQLSSDPDSRSAVDEVRTAITDACAAADTDPTLVRALLIGTPGYVDPHDEELSTETLPGWPTHGVRGLLATELGLRVRIENDVNLATIAERKSGSAMTASSFVMLWLGNGVGSSFDIGGALHRGASGGAGEIGFMPVSRAALALDPSAVLTQDFIGGNAVAAIGSAAGVPGEGFDEIIAALATHPARSAVFEQLAVRITHSVIPLLAVLDPELVVLGGPTNSAGGDELAAAVGRHIRELSRWRPVVASSSVTAPAVLRGARVLLGREVRAELLDSIALVGG